MAYAALGKLKKNSPEATLTAGIDDTTGTIPVDHLEYFHDDDGTLIVKGIVIGPNTATATETEEITITGASGTTGAGNLTGGTRGVNADGTIGAAKAWDPGTVIKVTYTTGIHNQIRDNFTALELLAYTQPIGIEYDFTAAQPSPTLKIIDINGNALTSAVATALIALNPLFTGIKRCNLSNTGVVNAWWGDPNFSYTGSNGQCMTRYPGGYYREETLIGTSTKKWRQWVSAIPWGGFRPHPAFMSNGIQNPEFYVGTFPASIYDSTTSTYLLDDEAYTSGDTNMLASIAGVGGVGAKPASGWHNAALTKTVFRTFAQNRGTGWNLWGFNQVAWIELLTYIKYGTFNLQATFPGVSNITDDGATNMAVRNGATAGYGGISGAADLGNTDGQVTIAHYQTSQSTYPFNLLGLENPYGNIWSWVDYLKIHNNIPWIADYNPDDATTYPYSTPYVNTNLTLLASNDWPTQIARSAEIDYGFLPASGGGSSASGLCDYYWQAAGDMAALFGGSWAYGAYCGPACWYLAVPASLVDRTIGGRVFFAKKS